MEKRFYQDTGLQVSLLGMGCMRLPKVTPDKEDIDYEKAQEIIDYAYTHGVNYFDTAYPYHSGMSETFVGHALKKYPRDSFFLASKLPLWLLTEDGDVEKYFNEQLEKCQVDYFDFYLLHAMSADRIEVAKKYHVIETLDRLKKEGKIRHLGFSFHDTPAVLEQVCDLYPFEFAQIQLNYLDWEMQDSKGQYEVLTRRKIPVIIMEPVRGGALAKLSDESDAIFKAARPDASVASWAIRFAATLPNVMTVLSGMSNLEQVQDNVATMTGFEPVDAKDQQVIDEAVAAFKKNNFIPCTGCRYCMDCPFGVDIPKVFSIYNNYAIHKQAGGFIRDIDRLGEAGPSHCQACGACMEHCPQHIQIPDRMAEISALVEKLRG